MALLLVLKRLDQRSEYKGLVALYAMPGLFHMLDSCMRHSRQQFSFVLICGRGGDLKKILEVVSSLIARL